MSQGPQVSAADYQQALQWYKTRGETVRSRLLTELRTALTAQQTAVESQIEYRLFADNGNIAAYATRLNGKRVVDVGAGLLQVLDWVATASAAVLPFRTGGVCANAYVPYLSDGIRDNTRRRDRRVLLEPVKSFFAYAESHSECEGISEPAFRASRNATAARDMAFAGSFKLLLAHEMSHHLHGHVDLPRPSETSASRARETQADKTALVLLTKSGTNPMEALPLLLMFGGINEFADTGGSHPSSVERLRWAWEAAGELLKEDKEFKRFLERSGQYEQWQRTSAMMEHALAAESEETSEDADESLPGDLSDRVQACLERRIRSCMRDCTQNYDYGHAECRDRLCSPKHGSNTSWERRCRRRNQ
jgi:hypothetical protein